MKARLVSENINFERGGIGDRTDALDRILDRKITIQLDATNVFLDDYGKVSKGINEDNDHFLETIEKSGAEWKQLTRYRGKYGGVPFEFSGSKEQLLPIIGMWDAHGRNQEELADALEDWDGSEDELWEIIG